jgi:hypothetical protein
MISLFVNALLLNQKVLCVKRSQFFTHVYVTNQIFFHLMETNENCDYQSSGDFNPKCQVLKVPYILIVKG